MRSFLLLVLVTIFVVSFSDAFWSRNRSGGEAANCKRRCESQCESKEGGRDVADNVQQAETTNRNDQKGCKRSWLLSKRAKCADKKDSNVDVDQPAKTEPIKDQGDKKCKRGWMFSRGCANGQDNNDGKKRG
ncbi:uncharacterized protein [Branchiostoma lanceolatum]|uniref:uncharacterized protein n=1 Tax=Branchiostoma lanceolatum TaxID=7740 RepID=UPI003452C206